VKLADALLRLFGIVSAWNVLARGFGFLLSLPIVILAIADWRVRRQP
jgi:hypothetical protein